MTDTSIRARRVATTANPAWPFTVPLVGLPVWWVLGLWQIMFFVMAVPMAVYLLRQRAISAPRGFGVWLLWILWLLTGLLVMQVDAPGTVEGINVNRYLSFGFRFGWYLVATIAALYVLNTRHILRTQTIMRAVAWFFVAMVGGGVLGTLAPQVDMPSVLQAVLPQGISGNSVVNELTRVRAAQIQDFLGAPQARPSAPYIYTNEWGFTTAISMPFFVAAWWSRGRPWRWAMVGVLAVALTTIIASLNRGTWLAILAAIALALMQAALRGNLRAIAVAVGVGAVGLAAVVLSPLGDLVMARLDNGHSDNVRGELAGTALRTAAEASPIVGFGTTRYVLGTFASIAGGATDACPSCEPPPLGTHGQLWLVAFGAGFVGVALFVGFLAAQLLRHLRVRTAPELASTSALFILLVTLPTYNSVGVPLYLGLVGVGILARHSRRPLPHLQDLVRPVLRHPFLLILCCSVGLAGGLAFNAERGAPVTATKRVLVPATSLTAVPGARTSTLDTEAELATSTAVTTAIADVLDVPPDQARQSLQMAAEPNTRVLLFRFEAEDAARATLGVEVAVRTYLAERADLLSAVASDVRARYGGLQSALDEVYTATRPIAVEARRGHLWETLHDTTQRWNAAADVVAQYNGQPEAQEISGVTVAADDTATVRVASGISLGLLGGVVCIWIYNQRRMRIGAGASPRTLAGMPPVIARASTADDVARLARRFGPVGGVIADPECPEAINDVAGADLVSSAGELAGARALMVVTAESRVGRVRTILGEVADAGVEPIGLILLERPSARIDPPKRGTT